MKTIIITLSLLALNACAIIPAQGPWNELAYVDPTIKPNFGYIKSLQQPGMY